MRDEMRFDDDVVIITGAGRGLGREHALAFGQRGAAVLVNDIDDEAEMVAADIRAQGGRAQSNHDSVTDGAEAIVIAAFGKVTILVNNAGIISFGLIESVTDAQ